MAVIVLYTGNILIAFREELVIVQVTGVAGDAVVVAHVDSLCHLFAGYQCLIQFLAVARADGLHLRLTVISDQPARMFPSRPAPVHPRWRQELSARTSHRCARAQTHRFTRSTASSSVIMKRVMLGSVTVMGLPFFICSTHKGITEPRLAITLP